MDKTILPPTGAGIARRSLRPQAGMTMLEILIVLAIIALVMGFLFGPRILEMFGEAKTETAGLMVNKYANEAYARWVHDTPGKQCPDGLQELAKYTNNEDTKDPWGNELIMVCGENAPEGVPNHFGVMSKGEDGKEGTSDDIKSWEKKGKK
jgi:prepilin-type N-terminal cleavage/methylation domain-containing protein